MKNIPGGINRLMDIEESIHNLDDRVMESTQAEEQKEKGILKSEGR